LFSPPQQKAEKSGKKSVPVSGANKRAISAPKRKPEDPPKLQEPKEVRKGASGSAWVIPN
jgi:hypothetical protein